ncbi:MAG: uridine kinase [Terriglobia bacterium]|jgi:uridine kinase
MIKPSSVFLIAVGGGTGSGKTTIVRGFAERYASLGVVALDQDSYYFDLSHLPAPEREEINFDDPRALDHDLICEHLEQLGRGEAIEKPRYSFATHTRTGEFDRVDPAPLVLLEGLFALWDPRVRTLAGLRVFVDGDTDVRFIRRLRRDVGERGRTWQSVVTQYLATVRVMHHLHVEPTKAFANLLLDTTQAALEDSLKRIDQALAEVSPIVAAMASRKGRS